MKLDSVAVDGSSDSLLIRLYDFDTADVSMLLRLFSSLSEESQASIELDKEHFVETVHGCRLTLIIADWDQGIVNTGDPDSFRWAQTTGSWDNIHGLAEPFENSDENGFQRLNSQGVPLLISRDGRW